MFGSVLRDDFRPDSDVDVLVEFEPAARVGYFEMSRMELELSELLGRRVDLRTPAELSRYFRDRVESSMWRSRSRSSGDILDLGDVDVDRVVDTVRGNLPGSSTHSNGRFRRKSASRTARPRVDSVARYFQTLRSSTRFAPSASVPGATKRTSPRTLTASRSASARRAASAASSPAGAASSTS